MTDELWKPAAERVATTQLRRFLDNAASRWDTALPDYDAAWAWSVAQPDQFWRSLWDFGGVIGEGDDVAFEAGEDLRSARFFPGAKLNYAENLLRRTGPEPALIFHGENGLRREMSWDDLHGLVSRLQQALRALGVGPGDRVAGFVPNMAETIAATLATASLGAVWTSCSPDFGIEGVVDRFGQVEPVVLFCADGYFYNGKRLSSLDTARQLADRLPSLRQIVVWPYLDETPDLAPLDGHGVDLAGFIAPYTATAVTYERVDFRAPLFIMFSSGTTGLPKCIVHGTGGTLLQHLKEHQLQCDLKPHDRLMYFTTCGWMMWNWMVSGLATGATLVLYDGSPFYPDGNRLANIVAAEKVTHFGTSAKYIDACAKADIAPVKTHDLAALRTILSTGSPLAPDGFDYIYRDWKADVCLSSIAGGTDVIGCFVGGNPIGPVLRGQCQKRHLGMDVRVFDGDGNAVVGEPGELVCLSPHPSMPVAFWNDPDGARYHGAYFDRFENVWCHGDWVELTAQGGMVFHGRSDATLNPGGVRIGTAEIYRQVERIPEVLESLVIGQQWDNDVRVVLFVRLRDGVDLDEDLVKRIKSEIRTHATPRHVPAKVVAVDDIPRTKSGKITELAVRDVVHGRPVKNVQALANPEALVSYKDLPELQS